MTAGQTRGAALLFLCALLSSQRPAAAQEPRGPSDSSALEARVWLDRGAEPLLRRGETARLYYSASHDAFVSVFQIDTNGGVRLLFPRSPDEPHLVQGGFDYRLLFTRSPFWRVDDDPGVGYFFLVASPEPFDFSAFRYSHFDRGWNLSSVGRQVYRDPHVAMDDFVAALIPDWQSVPYALDFVSYQVDARFDYPRFLCYDCHGFRPYSAWNPYLYDCTSFRLVVYRDPYYYPATRYRGDRVVFVRPPSPSQPRFTFKERASNESARPLMLDSSRRLYPPPARVEAPLRPRSGTVLAPGGAERPTVPGGVQSRPGARIPGGVERRPSSAASGGDPRRPAVAAPGGRETRPAVADPRAGRPSSGAGQERSRPVLQPRPSSPPPASPPPTAPPPRTRPQTGGTSGQTRPGTPPPRPSRENPPATTRPAPARGTPPAASPPPTSRPAPARTTPPPVPPPPRRPPAG
jgi:hypothetical protein